MAGKGFTVLKKVGDAVKAGEPVILADLKAIADAGHSTQTMLIITEPADDAGPAEFIDFGAVTAGQRINK